MQSPVLRAVLRVTLPYLLFAGLWIVLSDTLLGMLVDDADRFARWSIWKGGAFVLVTGLLLVVLLRREFYRREASEAVQRLSEQRLRLALDAAHMGIFDWDIPGRHVTWSRWHEELWGYCPGEFDGSYAAVERRVHPDDLPRVKAEAARCVASGQPLSSEFRIVLPDGTVRWVLVQGEFSVEGGVPVRLRGVVRGITARKQRERHLHELITVIQQLATARNRATVVTAVRTAARRLTGADGATFILREGDWCHYVDEEAISPLWKGRRFPVDGCISGWAMTHGEPVAIRDIDADPRIPLALYRETFVKSLAMVPIRAAAPVGAIGAYWARRHTPAAEELRLLQTLADAASIALENVDTYTRLEQRVAERTAELAVAKERAEAADRLKSAFLATMSHELRTPLNSVIGFTGVLLQGLAGPLGDEQRRQLGMVQGSARHLLALINDVLDISKIEAGELQVNIEPFDLPALVAQVVATMAPQARARGLTLDATVDADIGTVTSDARRIEQILTNLLNNAVKFTERGQVTLSVVREDGRVRMAVADTGIGIRAADIAGLFRPFRQIDSTLSRAHEGTGLGLAICQRLAQLLGGSIAVDSQWGKGSVFTVVLPLRAGPSPAAR